MNAPDLLNTLGGVEMSIGKSLEDDETFVFVDEVISLIESHH